MADVVVARIQNRRGLRRDLPQPLAPGEIGFCTDTGEMFIGTDPENPNGFISPVIEAYNSSTASNQLINSYCSTQVVQIILDDPETEITPGDISVIANGKMYVGYLTAPDNLPNLGLGTERWFTDDMLLPSNIFVQGLLALDDMLYNIPDAGAIAEVINFVDNNVGIVTVSQNVQIWTRSSDINVLSNNIEMPGLRIPLPPGPQPEWIKIEQSSFDVRDADTFIFEYGLAGESQAGNDAPNYTRTGSMRITNTNSSSDVNDSTKGALVSDTYTEITSDTSNIEFSFRAQKADNQIWLEYKTAGSIPDNEQFYLSSNSRRWKSFTSGQPESSPPQ